MSCVTCTKPDQKNPRRPGKIWKESTAADLLFLPVFPASRSQVRRSTKAHEDRTLHRSSPREQRNRYLIQTSGPNGRRLRTGRQLSKTGTPLFEIFAIFLFKNSFFATSC